MDTSPADRLDYLTRARRCSSIEELNALQLEMTRDPRLGEADRARLSRELDQMVMSAIHRRLGITETVGR